MTTSEFLEAEKKEPLIKQSWLPAGEHKKAAGRMGEVGDVHRQMFCSIIVIFMFYLNLWAHLFHVTLFLLFCVDNQVLLRGRLRRHQCVSMGGAAVWSQHPGTSHHH